MGIVVLLRPHDPRLWVLRYRELQYVHGLLIVSVAGDDNSLNADKWVMAYGSKEDLVLNAIVGFHDLNDL